MSNKPGNFGNRRKGRNAGAGVGALGGAMPEVSGLLYKIALQCPMPEVKKKPRQPKIPGQQITGKIKHPFELVQECRRLHEQEHLSCAKIAALKGLSQGLVQQWCDYTSRANR